MLCGSKQSASGPTFSKFIEIRVEEREVLSKMPQMDQGSSVDEETADRYTGLSDNNAHAQRDADEVVNPLPVQVYIQFSYLLYHCSTGLILTCFNCSFIFIFTVSDCAAFRYT